MQRVCWKPLLTVAAPFRAARVRVCEKIQNSRTGCPEGGTQTIRRLATIDPRASCEAIFEGVFRRFRESGFFHRPVSKRLFGLFNSPLESEPRSQLNLTSGANCGEYPANVVGEIARRIFEDSVSVASQRQRALRVTWDCEIRMIEQIVGFRSKHNFCPFPQWKALLQRETELSERGSAQDVTTGIAKPAGRRDSE